MSEDEDSVVVTMEACGYMLKEARENELETEVVVWGLKEMQVNPSLKPEEALFLGLSDWIK